MSSQGWGEQLKLEGFEQALSAPSKQSWINDARIVIRNLALESLHTGHPFTSEHVIAQIGLPAGEIGQHRNNQVGALMGTLGRQGKLRAVGKVKASRAPSHAAPLTLWVGTELSGGI